MKLAEKRPYDSSILTMVSGGLILAIGLIAVKAFFGVNDQSNADLVNILIGTLSGAGLMVTGALLIPYYSRHRLLGVITMVLAITSFPGTSGGLYIGAIGALLGGIMSISWHRKKEDNHSETEKSNGASD